MKNMQRYAKSTTLPSGMIIETEKKKKNNNKIRYSSETLSLRTRFEIFNTPVRCRILCDWSYILYNGDQCF